ncbi:hypothetical protein GCM10009706_05530 [Curtobacterium citreum]|nr:hypothetical protein GCM10009706_05530 [Curtobacterium citreum]
MERPDTTVVWLEFVVKVVSGNPGSVSVPEVTGVPAVTAKAPQCPVVAADADVAPVTANPAPRTRPVIPAVIVRRPRMQAPLFRVE